MRGAFAVAVLLAAATAGAAELLRCGERSRADFDEK